MEVSAAWEPISVVPLFPLKKSETSLCKISMATSRQQECLSKHVFTADGLAAAQRRHLVNGLAAMKKKQFVLLLCFTSDKTARKGDESLGRIKPHNAS